MLKRIALFSDLARMYFPNCATAKNAVRCLNRWIKNCDALMAELLTTGYRPYNHRYLTPKQYFIITQHLGDPFDE